VTKRENVTTRIRKPTSTLILIMVAALASAACGRAEPKPTEIPGSPPIVGSTVHPTEEVDSLENPSVPSPTFDVGDTAQGFVFNLTSEVFVHEGAIPSRYSCDGENISPPLAWNNPANDTLSFALIIDDPDAPSGTWIHWVLYNIPSGTTSLSEAIPPQAEFEDGSRHGENSWGRTDYGGPCPPGGTHRYFFKLYALDTVLDFDSAPTKEELLQATEGHVLATAELMGTYAR
jgi:Raf kinase inhibitor-like YbhB/YbcL family protein